MTRRRCRFASRFRVMSARMSRKASALPPWLDDIYQSCAPLMTVEECAAVMRVVPETVRRYCRYGTLRSVQRKTGRGGSALLIPRAGVVEWLRKHELHQL